MIRIAMPQRTIQESDEIDRLRALLVEIGRDFDQAISAHDANDPRHPSHGGQHTNGPCCPFGNVQPSALRQMRFWRDQIRALAEGIS